MKTQLIFFIFCVVIVSSCKEPTRLDKLIVGTWGMSKVFESDKDVSDKHNPKGDRWIRFSTDGTFTSGGEPFGTNTGQWSADNDQSILYLDSDVDDDDSQWNVTFGQDQMIWTGRGHPRKESTRLIHERKSQP